MLIQHNRLFTDSCIHVDNVRWTRKNQKDIHFDDGKITSLCEWIICHNPFTIKSRIH